MRRSTVNTRIRKVKLTKPSQKIAMIKPISYPSETDLARNQLVRTRIPNLRKKNQTT